MNKGQPTILKESSTHSFEGDIIRENDFGPSLLRVALERPRDDAFTISTCMAYFLNE